MKEIPPQASQFRTEWDYLMDLGASDFRAGLKKTQCPFEQPRNQWAWLAGYAAAKVKDYKEKGYYK